MPSAANAVSKAPDAPACSMISSQLVTRSRTSSLVRVISGSVGRDYF